MKTQYLRTTTKTSAGAPIVTLCGVIIALDQDGLKFGLSKLNPHDAKTIEAENNQTKQQIAALKRQAKKGKEVLDGLPSLKPVFDKKKAVAIAKENLVPQVDLNTVDRKQRGTVRQFVRRAIASHFEATYLKA